MRLLRLLPLLLLPALFLGDTCVTKVDQQGPSGPWLVEVTNTGPEIERLVSVTGLVLDANGSVVLPLYFNDGCPYVLSPGEKGYFASPYAFDFARYRPNAVQPFHLSSLSVSAQPPDSPAVTGVSFRVRQRFPEHNAILVEATNNSSNTYGLVPCAVNFDRTGKARDVASPSAFLGTVFRPGDVITFPVHFNSPVDGTFQFSAPSVGTEFDTVLTSVPFDYSTRVVETDKGRELEVVGEITNTSAVDLGYVWYEAYLDSSPTVRTSNLVGSSSLDQPFSGSGVFPAGRKALVSFTLPLDEHDSDVVKITGVVGKTAPSPSAPRYTFVPPPVTNIASETTGSDTVKISATLSNPRDDGLNISSVCFYARDAAGRLIGGQCGASGVSWIEPHGSVAVSKEVTLIGAGKAISVDVVAYGDAGPKPHEIVPPT